MIRTEIFPNRWRNASRSCPSLPPRTRRAWSTQQSVIECQQQQRKREKQVQSQQQKQQQQQQKQQRQQEQQRQQKQQRAACMETTEWAPGDSGSEIDNNKTTKQITDAGQELQAFDIKK